MGIGRALGCTSAAAIACLVWTADSCTAEASASSQKPDMAVQLQRALDEHAPFRTVAPLLAEMARQTGYPCNRVGDYQIYRATSHSYTVKVRCPGQPTYVVRLDPHQRMHVAGGDGTIRPIDPRDGAIIAADGVRAAQLGMTAAKGPVRSSSLLPQQPFMDNRASASGSGMLQGFLWAVLTLAVFGGGFAILRYRSQVERMPRFTSDEKDVLLQESQEILPAIYYHPEGWFIAKGKHGKRRIFRTLFFAYLYRSCGLKFGEAG